MNRRGFLGSILAAAAAPAIVRADSLMRIVPLETGIILPECYIETGTWEPTVVGGSLSSGRYIRIGNVVTITGRVQISGGGVHLVSGSLFGDAPPPTFPARDDMIGMISMIEAE